MERLYGGRFVNLVRDGRWEYCERVNNTRAAMIFARTDRDKILLVEEYRPPIRQQSICFPAGLVGDEGEESAAEAARRELLEETGYAADSMLFLFSGPSSPGITSECLDFFLADGLRKVSDGGGVASEKIIVHEVPLAQIDDWLESQRHLGKAVDPRIYAGLYVMEQMARRSQRGDAAEQAEAPFGEQAAVSLNRCIDPADFCAPSQARHIEGQPPLGQ